MPLDVGLPDIEQEAFSAQPPEAQANPSLDEALFIQMQMQKKLHEQLEVRNQTGSDACRTMLLHLACLEPCHMQGAGNSVRR